LRRGPVRRDRSGGVPRGGSPGRRDRPGRLGREDRGRGPSEAGMDYRVRALRGRGVTDGAGRGSPMKAMILAGGLGSRLSEETVLRPKPMVEVGGKPILWHIMNIYAAQGVDEFVVALGYKGEVIKEYFLNFYAFNNDISIDLVQGSTVIHEGNQPAWKLHLVDTGQETNTGGRIKRLGRWMDDEPFMLTYGDGVA